MSTDQYQALIDLRDEFMALTIDLRLPKTESKHLWITWARASLVLEQLKPASSEDLVTERS